MKKRCKSIAELHSVAEMYIQDILKEECATACIVGLVGDLGSGKTAFTKEVAHILGITETITSPTFVIQKKYLLPQRVPFRQLIHIDAYRLESGRELEALDWQELIADKTNLVFIEWPELVTSALPKNVKKIYFSFINETTRKIEW